ncbi:MAG: hypothetical protein Q9O24_13335 [Gammaproteobacteria bacterium]|nr:hypothetical protein [Gammaproteobacteria bacterium]
MPIKNGRVMQITRPFCVVAALCFAGSNVVRADSVADLQSLLDGGQPQLALALAERSSDPKLERASIEWLFQARLWSQLESRLRQSQQSDDPQTVLWSQEQQVRMALRRGQGETALALLRELLWTKEATASDVSRWRLQIVQAYLLMHNVADTESAWRRFQLDYPQQASQHTLLQARLLLMAGRFSEVLKLPKQRSAPWLALQGLAQLQGEKESSGKLYRQFKKRAEKNSNSDQQRAYFWLLAAKAAQAQGELVNIALASDFALRFQSTLSVELLLQIKPREVWQAYLNYGQRLGNEANLLLGDDGAWFTEVAASLPLHPVRAKSLLAVVALMGGSEAARAQAHWQLLELLRGDELGEAQIRALYLNSARFPATSDVPLVVRLHLQQQALDDSDVRLAKRLALPLQPLPEGFAGIDLGLSRVLALLLVNEVQQAAAQMSELLAFESVWTLAQRLRLHGFVADLLARQQPQLAAELLEQMALLPQTRSERVQWWFAMAQVKQAEAELLCASRFYLKAAELSGGAQRWRHTSLRRAAQSLKQAGLLADARRLYRRLLSESQDAFQRAELIAEMEG